MKSELNSGVCVSCGRAPGRYYRECPYCGERVWQPAWRRAGRIALPALCPLLLAAQAWALGPALAAPVRLGSGFLLAAGAGLALLPCDDADVVASSRRELARWQAEALGGSLLMALCALGGAAGLRGGAAAPAAWAAALALGACAAAVPALFRVPRRAAVAAALVAAGAALG